MRCGSCGSENPEGLKFCNECGTALKRRCAQCGFIAAEKRALHLNPDFWYNRVILVAIYSELGREEEARAEAAEVLRKYPPFLAGGF